MEKHKKKKNHISDIMQLCSADATKYFFFEKKHILFAHENMKTPHSKVAHNS